MVDFRLVVKEPGVVFVPAQFDAIKKFAGETGGDVVVEAAEGGSVKVTVLGDQEFLYLPDGSVERIS